MTQKPIIRRDFIRKLMATGLTYTAAVRAYDAIVDVFEAGIVSGQKIYIGNVFSLSPIMLEPRPYTVKFKPGKSGAVTGRVYHLGRRLRYKFNLFKKFIATRKLDWL